MYKRQVNRQAKGQSAGSFRADSDPFVQVALKHAFTASIEGLPFVSEPFALGQASRPALIVSVPLSSGGQFTGMLASVVSIDGLLARIRDASVRDRVVFIVDGHGKIVSHPDARDMVPGRDVSANSPVVRHLQELPQELRATETMHFLQPGRDSKYPVEMIGTYSTIPEPVSYTHLDVYKRQLVHIGIADDRGSRERASRFPGDRERIRFQATQQALDTIRRYFLFPAHGRA